MKNVRKPAYNEWFGVMAAEARRNGSADLEVCRPPEPLWNPCLRETATTLVEKLCNFYTKICLTIAI